MKEIIAAISFIPNFLKQAFKGNVLLWQAYWLVFVAPSKILDVLLKGAPSTLEKMPSFIGLPLWLFLALCAVIGPTAVWRSAKNCKSPGWSAIARIIVVVVSPILGIVQYVPGGYTSTISFVRFTILLIVLSMIAVYFLGEITKSNKLRNFNEKYFTPITLLVMNLFTLIGGIVIGITS